MRTAVLRKIVKIAVVGQKPCLCMKKTCIGTARYLSCRCSAAISSHWLWHCFGNVLTSPTYSEDDSFTSKSPSSAKSTTANTYRLGNYITLRYTYNMLRNKMKIFTIWILVALTWQEFTTLPNLQYFLTRWQKRARHNHHWSSLKCPLFHASAGLTFS